jgi:electron transport complex protein RnfB
VSVDAIDALLPQTQCGQCGYRGCRPYAEAIAAGTALINQCPPGGDEVIAELAGLLGEPVLPLNTTHGVSASPAIAIINEPACIGCTLCIAACPVDAIVGAARQMHTVITNACTGCELCLPPCPVDCIALFETGVRPDPDQRRIAAQLARSRHMARARRLDGLRTAAREAMAKKADAERRQRAVFRAIERARSRRSPET